MLLNNYETIYILKPNVSDNFNFSLVNYYKNLIKKKGGQNISIQHRGRRHLNYNIQDYYDGIYVQMNYKGNGKLIKALDKSMSFNDDIIRYLTIKHDLSNNVIIY